jgi:hypothetical protein
MATWMVCVYIQLLIKQVLNSYCRSESCFGTDDVKLNMIYVFFLSSQQTDSGDMWKTDTEKIWQVLVTRHVKKHVNYILVLALPLI